MAFTEILTTASKPLYTLNLFNHSLHLLALTKIYLSPEDRSYKEYPSGNGKEKKVEGLPCSKRHNNEFFKVEFRDVGDFLPTLPFSSQPDPSLTCFLLSASTNLNHYSL